MRRTEIMTAGGVTLAGLGALVGLAIGSSDGGQKLVAQRAQPVEVRTQIVRRTINVYRREHPHHATGRGPGGASSRTLAQGSAAPVYGPTRTRSSGGAAVAPAAAATPVVSTRSSGSKGTSGSTPAGGSGTQPVRTRSSGGSSSGGGSGSHAVRTRSSGGGDGEGNGGGHGD